MRGALPLSCIGTDTGGIIPADAGSTYMEYVPGGSYEDHPRGCGEHT